VGREGVRDRRGEGEEERKKGKRDEGERGGGEKERDRGR
jgi:hypothetical protein